MAHYFITATSSDIDLLNQGKRLMAWHFAETTGSVAKIVLRNGSSVTGDEVMTIKLLANGSDHEAYEHPHYLFFPDGIFVEITGTVVGSITLEDSASPPEHREILSSRAGKGVLEPVGSGTETLT